MYKFYKAILYSPMNEQIYTRFFLFYFILWAMKNWSFSAVEYLYENYNIVTVAMGKKMVWCMVLWDDDGAVECGTGATKYSNWKNFPKIYNSIRRNPIATVEWMSEKKFSHRIVFLVYIINIGEGIKNKKGNAVPSVLSIYFCI